MLHLVRPDRFGISTRRPFADVVTAAYAGGLLAVGLLTAPERGRQAVLSPAMEAIVEPSDQVIIVG